MSYSYIDFGRIGKQSISIDMGYRPPPPPIQVKPLVGHRLVAHCMECEEAYVNGDIHKCRKTSCEACNRLGSVPISIVDGTEDMRECSNCRGTGWLQNTPIEIKGSIVWRERDQYASTDGPSISHRGTRGSGGSA